jgi:ankyrin repeat protein
MSRFFQINRLQVVSVIMAITCSGILYAQTPNERLLNAASDGNELELVAALKDSADVNAQTYQGVTALMYASEQGKTDLARILLFNGANPNVLPENGLTALMSAASFGYLDVAEELIKNHANLDAKDENGVTALMYAAGFGNWVMADMLIFYGANIKYKDNDSTDALMAASFGGHKDLVGLLVSHGADPNSRSRNGMTPLWFALQKPYPEVIDTLLKSGADPNIKINDCRALTPLAVCRLRNIMTPKTLIKAAGGRSNGWPFINHFLIGFNLAEFNADDIMMGAAMGLCESKSGLFTMIGMDTRIAKKRILEKQSDGSYYQLWEKRSLLYIQVQKVFRIPAKTSGMSYGPFIGIRELYTYGRYEGLQRRVNDRFITVPQIGFAFLYQGIELRLNYEYLDLRVNKISPHRVNCSLIFHINLINNKIMNKQIIWLHE